jgi:CheY-like chemotaxis protein
MQRPGLPDRTVARGAKAGAAQESVGSGEARQPGADQDAGHWVCVGDRKRVLIVDDNDRHLDILSAILGSVGFDVETCGSGAEALRRLTVRVYDVAVLDLVMPEVSGGTVAIEMRNGGLNTLTPVVVCTANVAIATRQLGGVAGIHAIIGKPINTADLILAVARAPRVSGERASPRMRI